MPHAFSVEIHDYLSREITNTEKNRERAILEKNHAEQCYCEGKLFELVSVRQYLSEHFDLKTQKYF